MNHNTIIEIDSKQFIRNLKIIRNHLETLNNNSLFCLPVKANAYGHDLINIAKISENYIDYFGVSCLSEGIALRNNNITKPILVFGAFSHEQIEDLISHNLDITISSLYKMEIVAEYLASKNLTARVHIKIDTGMNRIGVRPENAIHLIERVLENSNFNLIGIYSHLACADDNSQKNTTINQIESFKKVIDFTRKKKPNVICHIANSGALLNFPESYFDMIRPGILSYGYYPTSNNIPQTLNNIKPCFTLKSKVVYFKVVAKNQGISYNHTYFTKEQTRIVTLPIGYGDGYRRALSNKGQVIIRGKKHNIAGTICMDMLMVDIGNKEEAFIDDEVILIGSQQNQIITLEEVAKLCNTITYEILVSFTDRIPRIFK